MKRIIPALFLLPALAACVTIGGKMVPPTALLTLTPSRSDAPDQPRSALAAEAIGVALPLVPQALNVTRIPVYEGTATLTYLAGATWAEVPAALFKSLLIETVGAKTGRLVLDPRAAPVSAGTLLSGRLVQFGIEAPTKRVIVVFDAVLTRTGGKVLVARRFQGFAALDTLSGAAAGQALNVAANDVAGQVGDWVRASSEAQ